MKTPLRVYVKHDIGQNGEYADNHLWGKAGEYDEVSIKNEVSKIDVSQRYDGTIIIGTDKAEIEVKGQNIKFRIY